MSSIASRCRPSSAWAASQIGDKCTNGASPTIANNLLKGNGQYGAALIDCRGVLLDDNEAVRNGTFEHRKTTMWFKGRLYFLCEQ